MGTRLRGGLGCDFRVISLLIYFLSFSGAAKPTISDASCAGYHHHLLAMYNIGVQLACSRLSKLN
jgi:hypothetical protein